jgi:hypothetical protein
LPKVSDNITNASGVNPIALSTTIGQERGRQGNGEASTHRLGDPLQIVEVRSRPDSPLEARHHGLRDVGAIAELLLGPPDRHPGAADQPTDLDRQLAIIERCHRAVIPPGASLALTSTIAA